MQTLNGYGNHFKFKILQNLKAATLVCGGVWGVISWGVKVPRPFSLAIAILNVESEDWLVGDGMKTPYKFNKMSINRHFIERTYAICGL